MFKAVKVGDHVPVELVLLVKLALFEEIELISDYVKSVNFAIYQCFRLGNDVSKSDHRVFC